jgi:predicted RNA-binding protein Jag
MAYITLEEYFERRMESLSRAADNATNRASWKRLETELEAAIREDRLGETVDASTGRPLVVRW